jgi:hypothetical protein
LPSLPNQPLRMPSSISTKSPMENVVKLRSVPYMKNQLRNLPDLQKEHVHPKDTLNLMEKNPSKSQSLETLRLISTPSQLLLSKQEPRQLFTDLLLVNVEKPLFQPLLNPILKNTLKWQKEPVPHKDTLSLTKLRPLRSQLLVISLLVFTRRLKLKFQLMFQPHLTRSCLENAVKLLLMHG